MTIDFIEIIKKIHEIDNFSLENIKIITLELQMEIEYTNFLSDIDFNNIKNKIIEYFLKNYNIELIFTKENELNELFIALAFIKLSRDSNLIKKLSEDENKILCKYYEKNYFNLENVKEKNIVNENLKRKNEELMRENKELKEINDFYANNKEIKINNFNDELISKMEEELNQLRNKIEIEHDVLYNAWYKLSENALKEKLFDNDDK
ncbi:hypothetical protein GVAV_001156 [Gurleya vavrai]